MRYDPNAEVRERGQDDALLGKINDAVAATAEAEKTVAAARAELASRYEAIGLLLLEAKKLYPAAKDFVSFLEKVQGLRQSRAYELMAFAEGRITDEQIRERTRERVTKHRARKKLLRSVPTPKKPDPPSVTHPPVTESAQRIADKYITTDGGSPRVTESAEASAERRKAEFANLELSPEERGAKASAHAFAEFATACRTLLPKMIEADRQKARLLVSEVTSIKPKAAA